jgi:anti-sigma factor ChrR (cupin superfamily)
MDKLESVLAINGLLDAEALLAKREWQPLRPGVAISYIYRTSSKGPSAAFLHYQAGASVPSHIHPDFEHILILHGSQSDGTAIYGKGSLVIKPPDSQHQIQSSEGCIALAIWIKPVMFLDI